ncbi:MAG: hypothetical protein IPL27_06500 [Lewinellaceae bacterium]|nr:hypothetical protein [Lewinellaceae bacterium]
MYGLWRYAEWRFDFGASGFLSNGFYLQYSTNNGGSWSTTVPTYDQDGPAQTVLTRCNCDANPQVSSPTNTVTTAPGTCPPCPVLTTPAPAAQVTNSICTVFGGTPSGGLISAPQASCPTGSTLQYSTNNGGSWSTTVPTYDQDGPAQTVLTRCNCDANPQVSSPTSMVTTAPGSCPECPVLTTPAPAAVVVNSVCTAFAGTPAGGSISAPQASCPTGSILQYSTNNGGSWSTTVPTYDQDGPPQTILTRCNCEENPQVSSPTSMVTTVPGTCPVCPVLTTPAPAAVVVNSVCTVFGGTPSGGLISAPQASCPTGSTLQYSTNNGGSWSTTVPTYDQDGPAQTVLTRCNCDANPQVSSPTNTVTTAPGTCPPCPVLTAQAPPAVVVNSVCTVFGGTPSGGSIAAPVASCPTGSTVQYSTNNGGTWSTTVPTYDQDGPAQTVLTRCNCNANPQVSSPTNTVTTAPGTCPPCPILNRPTTRTVLHKQF